MPLKPKAHDPDDDFDDGGEDSTLADVTLDLEGGEDDPGTGEDDGRDQQRKATDRRDDGDDARRPRRSADEEDDEGYSARVRKRLAKERAKRGESERRAAEAEAEAARLRKQLSTVQSRAVDSSVASLDDKRKDLLKQIVAAREEGDTEKEIALQDELDDVKFDLRRAKEAKAAVSRRVQEDGDDGRARQEQKAQPREITRRFLDEVGFSEWSRADKAMLSAVDVEIAEEGRLTPDQPEYYDEMRKRMRKLRPDLFDDVSDGFDDDDDDQPQRRTRRRSPASAGTRESGRSDVSGSRVKVTAQDKRIMRMMKLDPTNAAHLREFAANKRQRVRSERADGDFDEE